MAKATKTTISHGQVYMAGSELPEHVGKTKSKLQRAAHKDSHQGDRPGMSGSGKSQVEDIVAGDTGRLTQPSAEAEKKEEKKEEKKDKK